MTAATVLEQTAKQREAHAVRRKALLDLMVEVRCAYPQVVWERLVGSRWPTKPWRRALNELVKEGALRVTGVRRNTLYRLPGVAGLVPPQRGNRRPSGPMPGLRDAEWLARLPRAGAVTVKLACALWGVTRHVARGRLLALAKRGALEWVAPGIWRVSSGATGEAVAA